MIPQLKSLLLPPVIRERLRAKTDSDSALPINLSTNVIERLKKDPVRADRLSDLAVAIWDHLEARRPGWGPWPLDTEDALVVSMLLGALIEHEVSQSILTLSEDEMAFVEQQSQEQGLSLEQILINSIVERVEGQR
ncbi:MAG: hypothetical protein DME55_07750 [Verrucomicrobia bacterium]|nr:MAG: hypothetical protein DME55_07750 [Verrucomicrobiota bacterium]